MSNSVENTYKKDDTIESLSVEQLELIAATQSDLLLVFLEKRTLFDVHRVRLMLDLGVVEAVRRLESMREPAQGEQKC